MAAKVVVSKKLYKRVYTYSGVAGNTMCGLLLGCKVKDEQHIVGCIATNDVTIQGINSAWNLACRGLPLGLTPCGLYMKIGTAFPTIMEQVAYKVMTPEMHDFLRLDQLLLMCVDPDGDTTLRVFWHSKDVKALPAADLTISDNSILDSFLKVRLQAEVPATFEFSDQNDYLKMQLNAEIEGLQDKVRSDVCSYEVCDSDILLGANGDVHHSSITPQSSVRDLLTHIHSNKDDMSAGKKKKTTDLSKEVVHLNLWMCASGDDAKALTLDAAPVIQQDQGDLRWANVKFPLDVVISVDPDLPLTGLHEQMCEAICRQLSQMGSCLLRHIHGSQLPNLKAINFKPSMLDHFITVVYPDGIPETDLEKAREGLHERFLIMKDRPVFRRALAYTFPDDTPPDGYLRNTHIGLPQSGLGGEVYTVDGTYSYHHYMQDRIDDNGWGCAYRSLQTLVSWFKHQGYTDLPAPTHRQIQQILVDIGDKEAKFVGSKQWIGSTEVSFVIDQYLGVTSKILFVNSGSELGSKGRELAIHFQSQGTPIMIGGGVLAHTILGVDFNEVSGDVKFLILDPHYTGAEDLKVIQDKGWCGWKGTDFWDQNAHYNLCMPQRPVAI